MTPTTDDLNRNEKREIFGSYNTNKQTKADRRTYGSDGEGRMYFRY